MTIPRPAVFLIGLDGATFDVLEPLFQDGTMPFLASLRDRSACGPLASTPHPISPAAWASAITGQQPGCHGVFDFVRVDQGNGRPAYTLVTSADLRCASIFEIASCHGRRVTALNFPCMFPPPPVNGIVVPGYVPWSYLGRAVHPREIFPRLKDDAGLDLRLLAVDWDTERKAIQGLPEDELARWAELHVIREEQWFRMTRFLIEAYPSDLTAIVFDGVDRIQHLCLHLLQPSAGDASWASERARAMCLRYFRRLDEYLAELVALAGPGAYVLVASDHGAQRAGDRIFYVNVWLEQQGYLRWADGVPTDEAGRLAMDGNTESTVLFDWAATTAAALTSSSNAITIRRAKRPGDPGVPPDQYVTFRDRLAAQLLQATDPETGEQIVERVLSRDEAFQGAACADAPDLTLELRSPGFISVLRAGATVRPRPAPYGTHHPTGIFMLSGPGVRPTRTLSGLSVTDVAPSVLHALGLPIPQDMDGTPALASYEPSHLERHSLRRSQALASVRLANGTGPTDDYDPVAETEVMDRLRLLGYLE
jgi:predicted AlkP superfamily phosphohydrolase/phosphomutase